MNPYQHLVSEYARFAREGKSYPLGKFPPPPHPELAPDAPKVLIFSPHPDDECIIGGLALRLLRDARMNVINVAVTQGSKKERQAERFHELQDACRYLGFGLMPVGQSGLDKVTLESREGDKATWARSVESIVKILTDTGPRIIFVPHERDWHDTHIGTHFLVLDALARLPADFECYVVETEFWGAMDDPNLMAESSVGDVTDLVTAVSFHIGEVRRNPYHLLLPAWLQDNVRRGGELVGGQGGAAPDFIFATLYRLRKWSRGRLIEVLEGGTQLSSDSRPGDLFK
ncbi:MAG: bacillithiol biosynthesis deacetylase BshB1 [Pedosphaera sp.]|nr:bacillithiol biosynthesis deacetylase BshB1 [Pedosphaera sp.]